VTEIYTDGGVALILQSVGGRFEAAKASAPHAAQR